MATIWGAISIRINTVLISMQLYDVCGRRANTGKTKVA